MQNIYERIGVKPIINGAGSMTELGGSLMPIEVAEAMIEASKHYVHLPTLRTTIENAIRNWLQVPAVHICSGASGGISIAAAAAMTKHNERHVKSLPIIDDIPNIFLVPDVHRNRFDHALHAAGGKLKEFANDPVQLEELLREEHVVAVYYTLNWFCDGETVPLSTVADLANKYQKLVIVDAAAQLPPLENFQLHLDAGADLVIFSGGKTIKGPQTTGLIIGNADLIEACKLNNFPNIESIGRPMKVSKEDMVGLYVAIRSYLDRDHDADQALWRRQLEHIQDKLKVLPPLKTAIQFPAGTGYQVPYLKISWESDKIKASAIIDHLQNLPTPIYVRPEWNGTDDRVLLIYAHTLQEGEEKIIAEALLSLEFDI